MPRREADRTGMFNCPHTGVALAVLKKLVARGQVDAGQRVVVVSTANGLKFTDFKIGYHDGRLAGVHSHHANQPLVLPNDYDAVRARHRQRRQARPPRRPSLKTRRRPV